MSEVKHTPVPWRLENNVGAGLGIFADISKALGERFSKDFAIYGFCSTPPKIQIGYEAWIQFSKPGWDEMQLANGELIVRAVNSHDDLMAALKIARKAMTNERYDKPRIGMEAACAIVDAAIAKAEPK